MNSGIRLKTLKVSGFRGFGPAEETIDLSGPVVILAGGNRSGKSSTLNAIEWALYGGEVVSGKVNIEERKGWQVKNMRCERASVELVLETGAGDITVRRSGTGAAGKRSQTFYFVDADGERHDEEEELWNMLGLGPKDFMSSAYLHQEVIRDLLVTVPAVRKAALDRLLGVSDLRNLFEAFKGIGMKSYESKVDEIFTDLENNIALKASSYKESLEEAKDKGSRIGLDKADLSVKGFTAKCAATIDKLEELAQMAKGRAPELTAPAQAEGFGDFEYEVNEEIDRLRVENPGAASQRELDEDKRRLDTAFSRLSQAIESEKELRGEKREIEKVDGKTEDIQATIGELEPTIAEASRDIAAVSDRLNVVNETIDYLEKLDGADKKAECPACGQEISPQKLLKELREFKAESADQVQELEEKKRHAKREVKRLQKVLRRLAEIDDEELPSAKKAKAERLEGLEAALGRKLRKDEDPKMAFENRLKEIEKAIEQNKKRLQEFTDGLSEMSRLLEGAGVIADALELEKKIKRVNSVKKTAEWKELEQARDALFDELGCVDKVKEAVEEVLREVSRKKVEQARGRIADIYRQLVERPDFEGIEIDSEKYEVYASGDGKREKLVTFFNQGDMNCAALAIFLALGTGRAAGGGGASFILMDDPSQSLDSVQKERLARVIDRATGGVQLLLSTMDGELLDSLKKSVSRNKRIYNLGAWDPEKGPDITEE